eukprot:ANDGO_02091.mRNA.1 hypothetical protein
MKLLIILLIIVAIISLVNFIFAAAAVSTSTPWYLITTKTSSVKTTYTFRLSEIESCVNSNCNTYDYGKLTKDDLKKFMSNIRGTASATLAFAIFTLIASVGAVVVDFLPKFQRFAIFLVMATAALTVLTCLLSLGASCGFADKLVPTMCDVFTVPAVCADKTFSGSKSSGGTDTNWGGEAGFALQLIIWLLCLPSIGLLVFCIIKFGKTAAPTAPSQTSANSAASAPPKVESA